MLRKNTVLVKLIVFILIIIGCITYSLYLKFSLKSDYYKNAKKITKSDKIWIISDIHYFSPSLHDDGGAFNEVTSDLGGIDLKYQKERLETLIWQVQRERPKVLIVSGDLTFNGEEKSAKELAYYFKQIEEYKTKVYVIPGNHDISNGWAYAYNKTNKSKVKQILPSDFKRIFNDAGYSEAFSKDKESLSYVTKPFKNIWFTMIDSNIYTKIASKSSPLSNGRVKVPTLNWLQGVIDDAKKENAIIIPIVHHNIDNHNEVLNTGFTLDNSKEVKDFFNKNNIDISLSGHIHAQNILSYTTSKNIKYDIATESFAILQGSIGEITIDDLEFKYVKKELHVSKYSKEKKRTNEDLLNYNEYSKKMFMINSEKMVGNLMNKGKEYDEVVNFLMEMNVRYFSGKDYYQIPPKKKDIVKFKGYKIIKDNPRLYLSHYINSIIEDRDINDNIFSYHLRGH